MNRTKRLLQLDSLRGIAALGVALFWHYQNFKPSPYPFYNIGYWFYKYGWELVDFFFVLSGFIFSYIYKEDIIQKKITFKTYIFKRFIRLYPLHFATLLFVACMQLLRFGEGFDFFVYPSNDGYHFMLNLFFIQSGWFESGFSFNAPSWSISSEIIAYIVFFMILWKIHGEKRILIMYFFMMFAGIFIILTGLDMPLLNDNMARVFLGFFMGCVTFEINQKFNKNSLKSILILLCVILLAVLLFIGTIFGDKYKNVDIYCILASFPLVIVIILNVPFIGKIFSIKPLVFLGDISYSIYLCHFPVMLTIKTVDDVFHLGINYSSYKMFIFYTCLVIVVSTASYFFLEKPCSKLLRQRMLPVKQIQNQ